MDKLFGLFKGDNSNPSAPVTSGAIQNMDLVDEAYETKMAAFEADCNDGKGEAVACHHVGEFYSVVKEDRKRAAAVYEKNCQEKGYGPSCFNLGRLFLSGPAGIEQDDKKAEELFGKACEQKHLHGCYHQAIMMYTTFEDVLHPKGQKKDIPVTPELLAENEKKQKDALKLFDWACKEGEYESCYFIAAHHIKKENPERNPSVAAEYYKKSCNANHAPSCYNLAVLYRNGDTGIEKNEKEFEKYKDMTNKLVKQYGGLTGTRAV